MIEIEQVVQRYMPRLLIRGGLCVFPPDIPTKKLDDARASYAKDLSPTETILMLYAPYAKHGFLITDRSWYASTKYGPGPIRVDWANVRTLDAERRFAGILLHVNGELFMELPRFIREIGDILEMLEELARAASASNTPSPALASAGVVRRAACSYCGAPALASQLACEFCGTAF